VENILGSEGVALDDDDDNDGGLPNSTAAATNGAEETKQAGGVSRVGGDSNLEEENRLLREEVEELRGRLARLSQITAQMDEDVVVPFPKLKEVGSVRSMMADVTAMAGVREGRMTTHLIKCDRCICGEPIFMVVEVLLPHSSSLSISSTSLIMTPIISSLMLILVSMRPCYVTPLGRGAMRMPLSIKPSR